MQALLEVRWETKRPSLVSTEILGFLSIFKKSQASAPFGSIELRGTLKMSRDVRPPVQMRLGPRAFSRDCTEDSGIPLYIERPTEFNASKGAEA